MISTKERIYCDNTTERRGDDNSRIKMTWWQIQNVKSSLWYIPDKWYIIDTMYHYFCFITGYSLSYFITMYSLWLFMGMCFSLFIKRHVIFVVYKYDKQYMAMKYDKAWITGKPEERYVAIEYAKELKIQWEVKTWR